MYLPSTFIFFFFNDTAPTEIYTLSLHDALPICGVRDQPVRAVPQVDLKRRVAFARVMRARVGEDPRSEEHTSELQSPCNLVCRLLLEKKKNRLLLRQMSRQHIMIQHAMSLLCLI